MAKDRRKLQHIHSSIADKQPTPQSLEVGEIAVNNAEGKEFLSLKNSNDKVVRFSSDEQIITWMEKKEVMPYEGQVRGELGPDGEVDDFGSYGITNDDLLNNKSNIVIKNNQVAASNTVKHDIVNGAVDIYDKEVNPTSDSGKTDGAGFAIDMSRYAMIGANPEFSSVTVTHQSNLSGTTNISDGASGDVLNVTTTNVNATDTNWNETIDTKTSNITTLNASATTATLSGNTLDIKENETTIESCGRISGKTNAFTIQECATGNGTAIINETNTNISGKTLTIDEGTSISAKTPSTVLSSTTTNISGSALSINEENTTIKSCTSIELQSDDLKFDQCTTGSVGFGFCNGFNVNSNAVKFEQCSTAGTFTIKEKTTNISGTTLDINEKDEVEIVGDNKVHIGGETVEVACDLFDVDANSNVCIESDDNSSFYGANDTKVGVSCTNQLSKNTVINSLSGTVVSSDSDTCIYGKNVNVGGDVRTRIGANCQGEVDSTYVEVSATTSITETAPIIELSSSTTNLISNATNIDAESSVCISAGTIACFYGNDTRIGMECDRTTIASATTIEGTTLGLSGDTTNISGATTLNLSGGSITEISTGKTCITAGSDLNLGGDTNTRLGYDCDGTGIANNTYVYASSAVTINAPTTNITGNTYLSGNTYFHKTCTGLTNNEIDAAFCEVLSRGGVSMDVTSNPAPGILKRYTISQNGANISGTANGVIDVPKDFLLKSAAVVYGNASADRTSFTACTGTQTNCHWYIELVFNVKDGSSEESKLYLEEDDFIKDITDNNPSGVVADSSYNNVAVKVEYDGKKNVVSATTTPTIHAKENIYADGNVSGTNVTASAAVRANNMSANTITASTKITTKDLDATGNVNITGTTNISGATTISGNTNVSGTTTVKGTLDAQNGLSKTLSWSYGNVKRETSGSTNFKDDKSFVIPQSIGDLSGGTLTLKHNGLEKTYNASSDVSFTAPHSALTVTYGATSSKSGNVTYDTSAEKSISIPTKVSHLTNDLEYLTVKFGDAKDQTTDVTYNGSEETNFTVPTKLSHVSYQTLTIKKPGTGGAVIGTYDPGSTSTQTIELDLGGNPSKLSINYGNIYTASANKATEYDTTAAKTITIPDSLSGVSNGHIVDSAPTGSTGTITINRAISVDGTITASGAIYSSDRNLKENIEYVDMDDLSKARNIFFRSFNFKDDESKRKTYGVIAQEVNDAGLSELVHVKDDGMLGVDYISLLTLKLASLEYINTTYGERIEELENKIKELESKIQ